MDRGLRVDGLLDVFFGHLATGAVMFRWLTERRRRRLLEETFPEPWTAVLANNVAAYALLEADEQKRLRELVQVFIAEKSWEGAGGLALDDEIRVTIAGTGCQLLLGRDHDLFAEVESIVIYPSAVVISETQHSVFDPGTKPVGTPMPVIGLAVKGGAVVLAWDSSLKGARNARDGRNVVIHELAHKIDFLDGDADGTPPLDGEARRAWAGAFSGAYLAHKRRAERGKKSLLDNYAITNEAEYFAVATEAFFEKPKALARELPEVYARLRAFYQIDLAAR